ncbi:hypothetical protein [Acidithiobacillus ferrivorans]
MTVAVSSAVLSQKRGSTRMRSFSALFWQADGVGVGEDMTAVYLPDGALWFTVW